MSFKQHNKQFGNHCWSVS